MARRCRPPPWCRCCPFESAFLICSNFEVVTACSCRPPPRFIATSLRGLKLGRALGAPHLAGIAHRYFEKGGDLALIQLRELGAPVQDRGGQPGALILAQAPTSDLVASDFL